ncbi:MAG: hypothetical protein IPO54_07755 [Micavibrio sp.]|nr:hypothetical protein [Micavibrio sp.]
MLAGIFAGYWFAQVRSVLPDTGVVFPPQYRQALKIILIVPLLAVLYGFMILQGSHIVFMRGDMRGQAGDLERFVEDINKASRMADRRNAEAVLMAAQVNTARLQAQGGIARAGAQQLHDETSALLDALALDPRHYPARIELARYYTRKKNRAEAFAVLEDGQKWVDAADAPDAYYEMLASAAMEQGAMI